MRNQAGISAQWPGNDAACSLYGCEKIRAYVTQSQNEMAESAK